MSELDPDGLIGQVKDIMTAYENRVLKEIENLIEEKIEPLDKVVSGMMVTVSDLVVKSSAFMEAYEKEAAPEFLELVREREQWWRKEILKMMQQSAQLDEE